jgi:hypothetical protein
LAVAPSPTKKFPVVVSYAGSPVPNVGLAEVQAAEVPRLI